MPKTSITHRQPFLRSIAPRNLLSFGPTTAPLRLENLNVLIGPNGSGKSNLFEAIALLRSTPTDWRPVISAGGGVAEWIWKGAPTEPAAIEVNVFPGIRKSLTHTFAFRREEQVAMLDDERIGLGLVRTRQALGYYYNFGNGRPAIRAVKGGRRYLARSAFDPDLSILAQLRDAENYPEITYLAGLYGGIRLYREWAFGRNAILRKPQRADLRTSRLEEDFSNLGLFLSRLRRYSKARKSLLSALRNLYEGLTDFDVSVEGGTVQVFLTEGEFTIPATRLSDGSLRYLCLLAILCDPLPPPVIGIEEPELGLHPDLLPKVIDLLVEASQRTQLIVTTHSDTLVDALTDRPSAVVVCEKHDGITSMHRLDPDELAVWLKKYRLGQLWARGDIGGNRW